MKVKKTDSGAWWPYDDLRGKIVRKGQPPHGYDTEEEAREAASALLQERQHMNVPPEKIAVAQ